MTVAICLVTCVLALLNLIFLFVIANFVVRMGEVVNETRNAVVPGITEEPVQVVNPDTGLVEVSTSQLVYGDPRVTKKV